MADKPVTREEKYLAYLTGDYIGEIPKPITRKEKYLHELCLKGIGGEISPEEIKAAVNEYLEKNPVKPGATTEQARQIEQNKTDVAALKEETGSLKEDLIGLESELIETVHGKNLLDISKCTANSYINSDTGIIEHDDRRKGYVTDLIPVKEGYKLVSSYYLNKVTHPYDMLSIAHYNANKNFIPLFTTNIDTYKIPSGVAYVRCTIHKNLIDYNGQLELNKDGIATTYTPYVEPLVKLPKK